MEPRPTTLRTYARIGRLYLRWAPSLVVLALIVFIPVGFIHAITINAEVGAFDFDGVVEILGAALAVIALAITGLLGEVFYTGAVAALMTGDHDGEPPSLREIAKTVEYGPLIAIDLLYGLAVAIGFILLFVPGIAVFVFFALAAPVIEIEHHGVRAAIARSFRLVRGRFWMVLALLLPIELSSSAITGLMNAIAEDLLHEGLLAHWLADVLSNLITTPFYAVAAVLLTVELIREKDGAGPRIHSPPGS